MPSSHRHGGRCFRLLSVVILAGALVACGSDSNGDTGSPNTTAPGSDTAAAGITIANFTFTTDPVEAGATVTVANDDSTTHSVVSDEADLFGTDSDVTAGSRGTITAPDEPGSYPVHCGIHSDMKAMLVVG
jgi:plastocyanin